MAGPRSMTGYGSAQETGTRLAADVEIRAVNARNLKVSYRTPSLLSPREPDLEKLVRARVRRGTLTVFVRVQLLQAEDVIRVRSEVVEGLEKALKPLRSKGLVEGALTPATLASIPGALETGASKALRPADWNIVKGAVQKALEALDAMRSREAVHLVRDLQKHTKSMRRTLADLQKRVPVALAEQQARMKERVDALLADHAVSLDDSTLAREMALVADRSDITEEITRLTAHLDEFDALLDKDGEVGRTLDFLGQEMLREINTIGSKSQDVALSRCVIALKTDIDRLKEQAANLE
ncbi:MAG: YicC/YloC family endoribonuclease [Planctomycetota bacterium]|jgi:uncharacterized protein (TIGR00255 family)